VHRLFGEALKEGHKLLNPIAFPLAKEQLVQIRQLFGCKGFVIFPGLLAIHLLPSEERVAAR
jgi:hypothetical protein